MLDSLFGEMTLTAIISTCSLLAVWVPFYRGFRLFLQGRAATRVLTTDELKRGVRDGTNARVEPVALLMVRTLARALRVVGVPLRLLQQRPREISPAGPSEVRWFGHGRIIGSGLYRDLWI